MHRYLNPAIRFLSVIGTECSRTFQLRSLSVPTIIELRQNLRQTVGSSAEWIADADQDSAHVESVSSQQQSDLVPRCMKDSYYEAVIPLSDKSLREKYINIQNSIRFGQLLENLDTFAVYAAYSHNSPSQPKSGRSPLSIITAMVDDIAIYNYDWNSVDDILVTGHVSWVGRSSMEITMWVSQKQIPIMDAVFVMVARDHKTKASAAVHPLKLETTKDKELFAKGERNKVQRLEESKQSLLREPPSLEEREVVHNLFINTLDTKTMSFRSRKLPSGSIWMEDTKLKNSIICFPEKRNIHNKIFGGYLMRKGLELAWANAYIFSSSRPLLKAVDDILFRCPVPIGCILLMSSQVCYSMENAFHIRVHAEVMEPMNESIQTSNTFNFTFTCDKKVPTVMPRTYGESMLYLDGRRHFKLYTATGTFET